MTSKLMTCKLKIALAISLLATCAFAFGQAPTAVHTFVCKGPEFQGSCPNGGAASFLTLGSDGNFYGTAQATDQSEPEVQGGLIFSLTPAGVFTEVFKFNRAKYETTGTSPHRLVLGPDGMLYGETYLGGSLGYGTLFRMTPTGKHFTVLHNFSISPTDPDGSTPMALVAGNDGNVYGATYYGGSNSCGYGNNCGTIFRVTTATGAYEVVANFDFTTTGENPTNLIVAPDGTFYGTTLGGSTGTVLFHFVESTSTLSAVALNMPDVNGFGTEGVGSVLGPDGNLYGIYGGEEAGGLGIFQVALDGSNLQTYAFYSDNVEVENDGLAVGSDGNLWMAQFGGVAGWGQILTFSPTTGSLLQTQSSFGTSSANGGNPIEMFSVNGTLWGVSSLLGNAPKGSYGAGVIFSLTP